MGEKKYRVAVRRSHPATIVVSCPEAWSTREVREAVVRELNNGEIDDLDYGPFADYEASVSGALDGDEPDYTIDETGAHDPAPPPIGSPAFNILCLGHRWATNGCIAIREDGPCPDPSTPYGTPWWAWRANIDADTMDRLVPGFASMAPVEADGEDKEGHPIFVGGEHRACLDRSAVAVLCPDLSNLRVTTMVGHGAGVVVRDGEPVAVIMGRRL